MIKVDRLPIGNDTEAQKFLQSYINYQTEKGCKFISCTYADGVFFVCFETNSNTTSGT